MAKPDSAKEEIGWLKVVFAVLAAIDASLIAWVAQVYGSAAKLLLVLAFTGVALATASIVWINRTVYRKIRELAEMS